MACPASIRRARPRRVCKAIGLSSFPYGFQSLECAACVSPRSIVPSRNGPPCPRQTVLPCASWGRSNVGVSKQSGSETRIVEPENRPNVDQHAKAPPRAANWKFDPLWTNSYGIPKRGPAEEPLAWAAAMAIIRGYRGLRRRGIATPASVRKFTARRHP